MEEKTFFNEGGVVVTSARFMAHGETYAMNGITSVKAGVTPPSAAPLMIVVVVGSLALMVSFYIVTVIAAVAMVALWRRESDHIVVLKSASGESQALSSKSAEYIQRVVAALNEAIVHRG